MSQADAGILGPLRNPLILKVVAGRRGRPIRGARAACGTAPPRRSSPSDRLQSRGGAR